VLDEYQKHIRRIKEEIEGVEKELREADQEQFLTVKNKVLQKYDELHEMQEAYFEEKMRLGSVSDSGRARETQGRDKDREDEDEDEDGDEGGADVSSDIENGEGDGNDDGDGEVDCGGDNKSGDVGDGGVDEVASPEPPLQAPEPEGVFRVVTPGTPARKSLRAQSMINSAAAAGTDSPSPTGPGSAGARASSPGGKRSVRMVLKNRSESMESIDTVDEDDEEDDSGDNESVSIGDAMTPSEMLARANVKVRNKASPQQSDASSPSGRDKRAATNIVSLSTPSSLTARASGGTTYPSKPIRMSVRSPVNRDSALVPRTRLPGDTNPRIPTRHVGMAPTATSPAAYTTPQRQSAPVGFTAKKKQRSTYNKYRPSTPSDLIIALRNVDLKYRAKSFRTRAVMKIIVWWRLVWPRKRFLKRMAVREMCQELLEDFLDVALAKGLRTMRQRFHMMRAGAAIKIQTAFRYWKETHLNSYVTIQRFFKRLIARKAVRALVTVVRAACRIARFLHRRKIRKKQAVGKKILYRRVIIGFMELIGLSTRDKRIKELKITQPVALVPARLKRGSSAHLLGTSSRRGEIYLKRLQACITIQSIFRVRLAKRLALEVKRQQDQRAQLLFTVTCMKLKRKILYRRKKVACACRIQSQWRGAVIRWRLMLQVLAGIKINSCWRKYKQYWKLKRCLRRIEIPVQIVLHGIRDIPANVVNNGMVKVRVSVWWTGLLHLVQQDDFMTVIQSKQPNIVRTTKLYPLTEMPKVEGKEEKEEPTPPSPSLRATSRKMSMRETANLLRTKSSGKAGPQTAEEKLLEFARLHNAQIMANKVAERDKKAMGINEIIEEDEDSNSDSNSDSGESSISSKKSFVSDSASPVKDSANTPGNRESFGSKTPGNRDSFGGRMNVDSIGRESINSLGSNLIGTSGGGGGGEDSFAADMPMPLGHMRSRGMMQSARNLLFTMSSNELPVQPRKHRNSLAPVHNVADKDHSFSPTAFSSFSNVKILSSALEAFKAPKDLFGAFSGDSTGGVAPATKGAKFAASLDDEELFIPGCHGNSVIRFDFYDGE
jgi:hypothetical protein